MTTAVRLLLLAQPGKPSLERVAYVVVCLVGLGPVLAVSLWRPLVMAVGSDPTGRAPMICVAAVVAAIVGVALGVGRGGHERPHVAWGVGVGSAAALGVGVGGLPGAAACIAVAAACQWLAPRLHAQLPARLDGLVRRHPVGALVWAGFGALCVLGTVRICIFVGDPAYIRHAFPPGVPVIQHHLCLTAYVHAAELLRAGVDNVYDLSLVPGEGLPASAAHMAPFTLDRYGYPPQFLLVPLGLGAVVPEFLAQRALWFGINGLVFAWTLWRLVRFVGPAGSYVALLGAPMLWTLASVTFQIGNAHFLVMALAILAMVAFTERRDVLGGGLLAAATLAKIAPGLLGVMLLVERRFRAAGWTVVHAVVWSAVSLWVLGWGPFDAFLHYHLPRIDTGEAYDFLDDNRMEIFNNLAAFATPFKLRELGVSLEPWAVAPRFGLALTVLSFAVALIAGLRAWRGQQTAGGLPRRALVVMWLSLLTLASLRSPMAPPYVMLGVLWAMLLVAAELRGAKAWLGWAAAMLVLLLPLPLPIERPMALALVTQVWMFVLLVWLVVRRWPVVDEATPGL